MHENNNYNYKKGNEELKKASKFFQMVQEFTNLLDQRIPLYIGKAKNLKKDFFIS